MEYKEFIILWMGARENTDTKTSKSLTKIAYELLSKYSRVELEYGITEHFRTSTYPIMPADIIGAIEAVYDQRFKRIEANEAWTLIPESESDSACWTAEIAEAYFICLPLIEDGDKVSAKMAFREAYNRLADNATKKRIAVQWSVSLGHDKRKRNDAVRRALDKKLISNDIANKLLKRKGEVFNSKTKLLEARKLKKYPVCAPFLKFKAGESSKLTHTLDDILTDLNFSMRQESDLEKKEKEQRERERIKKLEIQEYVDSQLALDGVKK